MYEPGFYQSCSYDLCIFQVFRIKLRCQASVRYTDSHCLDEDFLRTAAVSEGCCTRYDIPGLAETGTHKVEAIRNPPITALMQHADMEAYETNDQDDIKTEKFLSFDHCTGTSIATVVAISQKFSTERKEKQRLIKLQPLAAPCAKSVKTPLTELFIHSASCFVAGSERNLSVTISIVLQTIATIRNEKRGTPEICTLHALPSELSIAGLQFLCTVQSSV